MKISKSLAVISIVCSGFFSVFAQCPNSYFKPLSYSLFQNQPFFTNLSTGREDFNNDGRADIIGYRGNTHNIYLYLGNNQNGFNSPITINTPPSQYSPELAWNDFESDGDLDLIVFNATNPRILTVYQNNGSASFSPLSNTIINNESLVNVVDINNDQIGDLITFNGDGGSFYFYRLGNANGTFGNRVLVEQAYYKLGADFNNDGKIDFPTRNNVTGKLQILYNQGNGIFVNQNTDITVFGNITDVRDLNNDNLPDIITGYNFGVSVVLNNGNNNFTATKYPGAVRDRCCSSFFPSPSVSDFTGDGFLDIMLKDHIKPFYYIFKNNGAGGFSRTDYNVQAIGQPFGDIDGDNKTDLVSFSFPTSNIFGYQNIIVQKNTCLITGVTKIVDFDGNRQSDRTVWNNSTGQWKTSFLYQNDGTTSDINFYWGLSGDITTPGDYDGDGVTDYAVFRPSNGVWYIRKSSDQSFLFINFGLDGDIPIANDYDGDDKTDIAVFRPSNGVWYFLTSSNDQFYGVQWGISEDKPVPADFDGDGKSDIAVFRPSVGVWYILKSSDGQFHGIQWGISEDAPLPADYDGDGKADVAVQRASQNIWYVIGSYSNNFLGYNFGSAGDIPQPGDWNGDGISDIGVYRPSTKTWYHSTDFTGVIFGSSGDAPIGTLNKIY